MTQKLILPAEVKVCATCCYWDGERRVDTEMQVVVVNEDCHGECLVTECQAHGLTDVRCLEDCLWDDLGPENTADGEAEKKPSAEG